MRKETDKYCENIFMVLTMSNKKIRFNELHRTLTNYNAKMSKPTLIEHLKHLIKDEIIQRHEEDKQKVSYEINWKRHKHLKKTKEISLAIANQIRNEARFKSMSLVNQTIFITAMLTLGQLLYLKLIILNILEPENALLNRFSFVFTSKLYNFYTPWLLDSCKKSKENSQKILRHINKQIKYFHKGFIEIIPEATQQKIELSKTPSKTIKKGQNHKAVQKTKCHSFKKRTHNLSS